MCPLEEQPDFPFQDSQGPILALADALHGHPQVVCLILKLAGDVVEANISLLEVGYSPCCVTLMLATFVSLCGSTWPLDGLEVRA